MASCYQPIDIFVRSQGKGYLVPCGKCAGCLERKRQGFLLRAQYEMQAYKYCYFVTLSYSDDFLPYEYYTQKRNGSPLNSISTGEPLLCPYDLRKFFERYRHLCDDFSYFACGEYGSEDNTKRPHYHICLYCNDNWETTLSKVRVAWSYLRPETPQERYQRYKKSRLFGRLIKRDSWDIRNRISIGRDQVRCLSYKRITYVCKYVTKQINSKEVVPPFYRCSHGLGKCFLDTEECRLLKQENKHYASLQSGLPCALPRYLSQRMFSPAQMEAFQMELIFKDNPISPLDYDSQESYECAYKSWYKNKQQKELSVRRRRLLSFQGVRLV